MLFRVLFHSIKSSKYLVFNLVSDQVL